MSNKTASGSPQSPTRPASVSSAFVGLLHKYGASQRLLGRVKEVVEDPGRIAADVDSDVAVHEAPHPISQSTGSYPAASDRHVTSHVLDVQAPVDKGTIRADEVRPKRPDDLAQESPSVVLDTLAAQVSSANDRGRSGDPTGAAELLRDLLDDYLRILGPDNTASLAVRSNVAYWMGMAGEAADAAAEFQQLVDDRVRVLGRDHPDTLATRNNLAYMRGLARDAAGAAAEFQQLVKDRSRVLGADHPQTLLSRNNFAFWLGLVGDTAGAVAEFQQLLDDRVRVLGQDHPDTTITRRNLDYWMYIANIRDPSGVDLALAGKLPTAKTGARLVSQQRTGVSTLQVELHPEALGYREWTPAPVEEQTKILTALNEHFAQTSEPVAPDQVAHMTGLDVATVQNALRALSRSGRVRGIEAAEFDYPLFIVDVVH